MERTRNRRPRLARRLVAALGLSCLLLAPAGVAEAKLRRSEVPYLRELLSGIFGRTPSASSLNCVAGRLSAGTIDDLLLDGALADADLTQLGNSVAFRRVFKHTFGCQPRELVASLAAEFDSVALTSKQRTCMAKSFSKRIGNDEALLTVMIQSGLNDLDFDSLEGADRAVIAAGFASALRSCLPRSVADAAIDELIIDLLS